MEISLKFVIPSHPRYLSLIRAAVGELATIHELRPEESRGVMLAVDEALSNVIRHAYRGDFEQQIELTCHARSDRLEFALLDQGEAPDPVRLELHPLDAVALSGRGTHIIRSIMDSVTYDRVPGGNLLRLTKLLVPVDEGRNV